MVGSWGAPELSDLSLLTQLTAVLRDPVVITDGSAPPRVISLNVAARRLFAAGADPVDQPISALIDGPGLLESAAAARQGPATVTGVIAGRGGVPRSAECTVVALDPSGERLAWVVRPQDTTLGFVGLERAGRYVDMFAALCDAHTHAAEQGDFLAGLCRAVVDLGGHGACTVHLRSPEGLALAAAAGAGSDTLAAVLMEQGSPAARVLSEGGAILDRPDRDGPGEAELACLGLEAVLAVPVGHGTAIDGVLAVADRDAAGLDLVERRFLAEVGSVAASALLSIRARSDLGGSRQLLRTVIDAVPAAINVQDAEGRFLLVNRYLADYYGTDPEALEGRYGAEVVALDEWQDTQSRHREARLSAQTTSLVEIPLVDPSGRRRMWLSRKAPVFDRAGEEVLASLSVAIDITELAEARDRVRARDQQLASIAANLPGVVMRRVHHPDGRVTYAYRSGALVPDNEKVTDGAPQEADRVWRRLHPDDREDYLAALARSVETLRPLDIETRFLREDGSVRWFHIISSPQRLDDGTVVSDSVSIDITARKAAEAALEEQRVLLNAILDNLPVAIAVRRRDGTYAYANEPEAQAVGRPVREIVGRRANDMIPEGERAFWDCLDREALERSEASGQYMVRYATSDGPPRYLLGRKVPVIPPSGGDPIYTLGFATDVTDQVHAEWNLRERLKELTILLAFSERRRAARDADELLGWLVGAMPQAMQYPGLAVASARLDGRTFRSPGWSASVVSLSAPIRLDGREVGSLEVGYRAPGPPGGVAAAFLDEERELLDALAEGVGVELLRRDVESRLEEATELRRVAGEVTRIGPWRVDLPEMSVLWPPETAAIFDLPPDATPTVEQAIAYYTPDSRTVAERCVALCMTGGTPFDERLQVVTAKGRHRWVRALGHAVRDDTGAIVRLQGAVQDITETKQLEDEIERLASRLTTTLDAMREGFFLLDRDWRIVHVNRMIEELEGRSREDLVGRVFWDAFPSDIGSEFERRYRDAMATGTPQHFEELYEPAGRWMEIRAYPSPDGLAVYSRDIHDERRREEQLRLSQKMDAIGNLTGGIAHDFNNVLAVVIGNLDLLLESRAIGEDEQETGRSALAAAERGADLTRRLLSFTRREVVEPTLVDCNGRLHAIAALLRRSLGPQIELVLDPAQNLWPVRCDPALLETAVMNLAINASDAMGGRGRIHVQTRNVAYDPGDPLPPGAVPGDQVVISVTDHGTGMSEEVRQRAFEPLFTTKAEGKGTGFGLAMVYSFARRSGGYAAIYSELGHGTTVRIHLPRDLSGRAEDEDVQPCEPADVRGVRVLLVDDNEEARTLLARMLTEAGLSVDTCGSAAEALLRLDGQQAFDLIVTDVIMPGDINGADLAYEVRAMWPSLPVLVISGFPVESLRSRQTLLQDFEILNKPFRKAELLSRIGKLLAEAGQAGAGR